MNNDMYFKEVTYDNVRSMWNIVRRTCKNKRAILRYTINQNTMNYILYQKLLNCDYKPLPFRLFLIFEPKERLVMSQAISDKIINHFVDNYYLIPYLDKKLIDSNVATRKGKGSKYADKLMNDYINKIRQKEPNKEIFVLKVDVSKYFYTISHDILMKKLESEISDDNVLKIIKTIIDETDKLYINDTINRLNKKHNTSIPLYKKGVGLSIGAMTSQFLAIFYLNDLDHYIKEKLHCKYYIRYMDDFIIIDTNRKKLQEIWKLIEIELKKLELSMNPKSSIISLNTGITFLGYKYKIINNRYKVTYRKKTIKKIRKKLDLLKKYDLVKYYKSYSSYYGYLIKIKYYRRKFTMNTIEKYKYFKVKYPKSIVFIGEKSYYKLYDNDAKIISNLFDYKINNSMVTIRIIDSSNIYDKLVDLQLKFLIIENDLSIIKLFGNNR